MWQIMKVALDWYVGKHEDGGLERCRTCPGKRALFAAVEGARAAHLTRVAPAALC